MLPGLLRQIVMFPGRTLNNAATSLLTRVLNVVPLPHPLLLRSSWSISPKLHGSPVFPSLQLPNQQSAQSLLVPESTCQVNHASSANLVLESVAMPMGLQSNSMPLLLSAEVNSPSPLLRPLSLAPRGPPPLHPLCLPPELPLETLVAEARRLGGKINLEYLKEMSKPQSPLPAVGKMWGKDWTRMSPLQRAYVIAAEDVQIPVTPGEMVPKHQIPDLKPLPQMLGMYLQEETSQWVSQVNPSPQEDVHFRLWLSRFPPRQQRELSEARQRVLHVDLEHKHAIVKAFIKIEAGTAAVDPRNISPRRPEFLAIIGPYIYAIEKAARAAPFLVKGLDPFAKRRTMQPFTEFPVLFETDYSRFDRTVSQDYLKFIEVGFIELLFPKSEHQLLHVALGFLLRTRGLHQLGLWYTTDGGRCSGDAQTSVLNGIINHFNTWSVLRHLPPRSWFSKHEGDDGLIGALKSVADSVETCLKYVPALGFKLKVLRSTCLEDITFCGRFYTASSGRIEDCADLHRALSKFHVTCTQGRLDELALAKALSYYHTDSDTPILGWWCYCIICYLLPRMRPKWSRAVQRNLRTQERVRFSAALSAKRYAHAPSPSPSLVALIMHRTGWSGGVIEATEMLCRQAVALDIIPVLPRLPIFDEVQAETSKITLYHGGELIV